MASRDKNRPNVLVVMTDDQGAWALGCAGNSEIRTPHLDGLAERGVRFENFFCASPVCSPARASFLTGRIPSQHGVHDWIRKGNISDPNGEYRGVDRPIEYLEGMLGYTDVLKQNGYACGLSGKWHLGAQETPQKGFDYWYAFAFGGGDYYDSPMVENGSLRKKSDYLTDVITDGALKFLGEIDEAEDPFYLSVHYTAPHSPWNKGNHPDAFLELYEDCPFSSCPDQKVHPWQINSAPVGVGERRQENLQGYFAAVTAMDAGVGRLLERLDTLGLRDNTLIVFTSDNGMNMGHHGIWGKGNGTYPQNMYDSSVKVPFIVSHLGCVPQGKVESGLFSHYDFFPTLLDYLGMENPLANELPGRSFAALFEGKPLTGRENVVVFDEYGPVRMIRNRNFKYVHRFPEGPHEFFDLQVDPNEVTNVVDDPDYQGLVDEMRLDLENWFRNYVDPSVDGSTEPVTGNGQLDWVGKKSGDRQRYSGEFSFYHEVGDEFES
ncbi:MAG: sulfatase-like hydrolase/transferase [Opitutaceae bacterium]|nr:sulfatase-like hydrolase/transferase [Opitutaceae bacterium]